jgi:type VI secretion system protein ImpH
MAGEAGRSTQHLNQDESSHTAGTAAGADRRSHARDQLLDMLGRAPQQFDFFQVMRRLESLAPDQPRFATAPRPADESIRLGQEPSMAFAPAALAALRPGRAGGPPWLSVNFFGLLGPNGPLPLHLTEYARDRLRNADDPTMSRFFDLFHHRFLLMLYRAWANGQPTVNRDRPETDRFVTYVGALLGIGQPAMQNRDDFPDTAKLFYAGRFAAQARNAEGLTAVIGDFFGMPARVEAFVGDWLELAPENRWAPGHDHQQGGRLGVSTTLGARAFSRQQKFRVVLGPLDRRQFQRMLPGSMGLRRLISIVRSYAGDELRWDVRLFLDKRTEEPMTLGRSHLGWTAWLGSAAGGDREDLILTPELNKTGAAA